jgi:small conductance mechanosensitive channel
MEINEDMMITLIIPWAIKIIIALAIFVIGKWIAKAIANFAKKLLRKANQDEMLVKFLGGMLYAVLFIAVVLAAIDQLGVNVTSLMVIISAAGLAIGLALKDSLSNFASGVMIIVFRPFKIGDFISVSGVSGVVDEIGMFCTLMHTGDNQRIIVPNSVVFGSTIVNASALATRRIDLTIGISYDDNMGKAKDIILDVLSKDSRVLTDPAPVVAVAELADSSVNLVVRPWVNTADYWAARWDIIEAIKNSLDDAGISIPYPQQDVYMHNVA